MKKIKFYFLALVLVLTTTSINAQISVGVYSQNQNEKWGYLLQIIDNNYIPQIKSTDSEGYITLYTGITDYDTIFAKYKITEFYQYAPTSNTEWIRQVYCLVCDSGQVELGDELKAKYSHIIPYIEIFYQTPIITNLELEEDKSIVFQSNGIIRLNGFSGLSKKIYLYNLNGELLYTNITRSDVIDCKKQVSNGIYIYKVIVNSIKKSGLVIIL